MKKLRSSNFGEGWRWAIRQEGFSLIELIIVIAIMAVLVAVIAPVLSGYIGKSKKRSDEYNANEIERILTYEVQKSMTNEDEILSLEDIEMNYNGLILRIDKMLNDMDESGQFKEQIEQQLGHNNFACKRLGYHYYVQVSVDSEDTYQVVCRSVCAEQEQLSKWP